LVALRAFGHWYGPRYVTPSVIGYVMLAGFGIGVSAQALIRRFAVLSPAEREKGTGASASLSRLRGRGWREAPGQGRSAALLLAIAFAWQAWPAARNESFYKLDWRAIAGKIHMHAHQGDLVIAGEAWSQASL